MKNILFYGSGNISSSIIEGLLKFGYKKKNIFAYTRNISTRNKLKKLKINSISKKDLLKNSYKIDIYVLGVKPKDYKKAVIEILNINQAPNLVSLCAGIKTKNIAALSDKLKVARVMPNTSCSSLNGISGIYNHNFSKTNYVYIKNLFKKLGEVIELEYEADLNDITALFGSGPAYFFYILKVYEKRINKLVNNEKLAKKIIRTLLQGVSESINDDKTLDDLIDEVSSKKGTTEAAIKELKRLHFLKNFDAGIKAALIRAKEISEN